MEIGIGVDQVALASIIVYKKRILLIKNTVIIVTVNEIQLIFGFKFD